jgi:PAS domain S-box-containing protein
VTSVPAWVYLIAVEKTRLCLLIDGPLAQLPETILLVDKASRAIRFNRKFIRMFVSSQKKIIGRTVLSSIVPEEFSKEAECFADLIAQ